MIDLYGRQAQREGANAIRRSLYEQPGNPLAEPAGALAGQGGVMNPAGDAEGTGTQLIDTSNAIGSLAALLGPTPAEREARQRRMEQNKQSMSAWAGLFDGLRQLGNLYYTAKGATPQQLTTPYEQIDKTFQNAGQLEDDIDTYRRQYAQQLYALRRQAGEDSRKNMLTEAQARYYDTRDEVARQKSENEKLKAENDRLKNEASIRNMEARTKNTEARTETEQVLRGERRKEIQSRIAKNNRTGGGRSGGRPYQEHYIEEVVDPATGKKVKKYVAGRYGAGNNSNKGKSGVNVNVLKGFSIH